MSLVTNQHSAIRCGVHNTLNKMTQEEIKKFENDQFFMLQHTYGFSLDIAQKIYNRAYQDHHAYFGEMEGAIQELADFIEDILEKYKHEHNT